MTEKERADGLAVKPGMTEGDAEGDDPLHQPPEVGALGYPGGGIAAIAERHPRPGTVTGGKKDGLEAEATAERSGREILLGPGQRVDAGENRKRLAAADYRYLVRIRHERKETALAAVCGRYGISKMTLRRYMKAELSNLKNSRRGGDDRNVIRVNGVPFRTQLPSAAVEWIVSEKLRDPRQTVRLIYDRLRSRLETGGFGGREDRREKTTESTKREREDRFRIKSGMTEGDAEGGRQMGWKPMSRGGVTAVLHLPRGDEFAHFERAPSERSVERIVEQIPEMLIVRALAGRRGLEAKAAPFVCRNLLAYEALELVVGDQHIFDFIVQLDDGRYIRPESYMWVDMRSRMFVGFAPCLWHYNSYDVASSLMRVCANWGLPQGIYTDWGKSETSKYVDGILEQLTAHQTTAYSWREVSAATAEITHEKAIVRNAKAKIIEGMFGTVERWLYEELGGVGYCKRQLDGHEDEEMIAALKRSKRRGEILGWREFFQVVMRVLDRWNRHLIGTDRIVPAEEFGRRLALLAAAGTLRRLDASALRMIFLPVKRLKVRNGMVGLTFGRQEVGLRGGDCKGARKLFQSAALSRYSGEYVDVRWNPYDSSEVYVFDVETGGFSGIATAWERIDPRDGDALGEKMRTKRAVVREWEQVYQEFIKGSGAEDLSGLSGVKLESAEAMETARLASADMKRSVADDPFLKLVMETTL